MKHTIKMLGLTVLAALGLLAMSASAAQALTLNLSNAAIGSGNSEAFVGEIDPGAILVPDLQLKIHCDSGLVETILKQSGSSVEGEGLLKFSECFVNEALKTCKVYTVGQAPGIIIFVLKKGEVQMTGATTFALLPTLSVIKIEGICAAAETEEEVSGNTKITIKEPEAEQLTHDIEVNEDGLIFGTDSALLHTLLAGSGPITGNATSLSLKKWSVTLP